MKKYFILSLILGICCNAFACTEIFVNKSGYKICGRNFDWPSKDGIVVVNSKGIPKKSNIFHKSDMPVSWVSQYGSVTFNIGAGDVLQTAVDGMNEEGLTVGALWLSESIYPDKDQRPVLDDGQFVQFCLDKFKTVAEVIAYLPNIRIIPDKFKKTKITLHFFLHDQSGDSAVVEYLEGNLVIHQGVPLSQGVLSNISYAESLNALKQYEGFGGKISIPNDYGPVARFVRAAFYLKKIKTFKSLQDAISNIFGIMVHLEESANSKYPTQWTIVRDIINKKLYFKTIDNKKVGIIGLKKLDFSQEQPIKIMDINAGFYGDVTGRFRPYSKLKK